MNKRLGKGLSELIDTGTVPGTGDANFVMLNTEQIRPGRFQPRELIDEASLEEAKGYARLLDEFGYTQEDIASAVGKDRTTITNLLRILTLPDEIQEGLSRKSVTLGHAKALLSLMDRDRQIALFHRVVQHELSVRQTETLAGAWNPAKRTRQRAADPQLTAWEDALRRVLGTKVRLSARKKGGRIAIDYFSSEDLTRILHVLGVPPTA